MPVSFLEKPRKLSGTAARIVDLLSRTLCEHLDPVACLVFAQHFYIKSLYNKDLCVEKRVYLSMSGYAHEKTHYESIIRRRTIKEHAKI
jgi:hypothetical protein